MDLVASLNRVLLYVLVLHLLNYFTGVLVKYTRVCVFTKGPSWLKCVCKGSLSLHGEISSSLEM